MALNPGDLNFNNSFNDATRVLEGGFWHKNVPEGNQGNGSDVRYTADLTTVQNGLQAQVAANAFTGDQLTHVNTVLADLTTALNNVQGAVNNDAQAEAALRTAHLDIINTIQNDAVLQPLTVQDGVSGFNSAPPELGTPLKDAPHKTFAELGAIFDDAQSKSLGGINPDNFQAIQSDLQIVHDGLEKLIKQDPQTFSNATGIAAQAIVNQLALQLDYDRQYGTNPDVARGTNDNLLDITDVVAGDDTLAKLAAANGVTGWTGAPDANVETPRYQDNAAQTNFFADLIASGNTLGDQAQQLVANGSNADINQFIHTLKGWEQNVTKFDAAQGGIFGARFDNELLGNKGTIGADVAALIDGLKHHDAALVAAAAQGVHDNAMDLGGNNVPLNGGDYNPDGKTIAEVLGTATGPLPAFGATLTPVSQDNNGGTHSAANGAPKGPDAPPAPAGAPGGPAIPAANDHAGDHHGGAGQFDHHQQAHHQWDFH
ncbi:MAG TPA: hypothetical protein VHN11_09015 [Xanthobacteraceae bacterium]|jgi:hypothetical protein|nr:hypothetical protein [Xanthobacteraceae bacterium]